MSQLLFGHFFSEVYFCSIFRARQCKQLFFEDCFNFTPGELHSFCQSLLLSETVIDGQASRKIDFLPSFHDSLRGATRAPNSFIFFLRPPLSSLPNRWLVSAVSATIVS